MADLKVDYQLLTDIHRTLYGLTGDFGNLDDQVSGDDKAFGSGGITAAMGGFAGNWARPQVVYPA